MGRSRQTASLVLGAFSAALTVLPWLHTLHHRDDHVHVEGGIVFLPDDHDHEHGDENEDEDGAPGFDHPAHHGPHGRGAFAHGAAFILAGIVYLFPPPGVAIERLPPAVPPEQPAPIFHRSPRVTRGPPDARV